MQRRKGLEVVTCMYLQTYSIPCICFEHEVYFVTQTLVELNENREIWKCLFESRLLTVTCMKIVQVVHHQFLHTVSITFCTIKNKMTHTL